MLLGNFEEGSPLAIQLQRLTDLSLALIAEYGITHLAGHRDFQPDETVCPGHHLEALLREFANVVGLEFGTEGYVGHDKGNSWISWLVVANFCPYLYVLLSLNVEEDIVIWFGVYVTQHNGLLIEYAILNDSKGREYERNFEAISTTLF